MVCNIARAAAFSGVWCLTWNTILTSRLLSLQGLRQASLGLTREAASLIRSTRTFGNRWLWEIVFDLPGLAAARELRGHSGPTAKLFTLKIGAPCGAAPTGAGPGVLPRPSENPKVT